MMLGKHMVGDQSTFSQHLKKRPIKAVTHMELRVLRYFLEVAQEGSVTRAAKNLHLTQPTLSRQIAQLEDELGAKLFDRRSNRMVLTEKGAILRIRAQEMVQLAGRIEAEISGDGDNIEGDISIGCGELGSTRVVTRLTTEFTELYPKVMFNMHSSNHDHVKTLMDKGLVDAGILFESADQARYETLDLLMKERLGVVTRIDDPLSEKESVTVSDLQNVPLIMPTKDALYGEFASWIDPMKGKLDVRATSNTCGTGISMVLDGSGIFLCSKESLLMFDMSRITFIPLSPQPTSTTVLAWRRDRAEKPAFNAFRTFAKKRLSALAKRCEGNFSN